MSLLLLYIVNANGITKVIVSSSVRNRPRMALTVEGLFVCQCALVYLCVCKFAYMNKLVSRSDKNLLARRRVRVVSMSRG